MACSWIENGGMTCEDPPGVREGGGIKAYLGYLRTHLAIKYAP